MRKQASHSFKDTIYRMFLRYAIAPAAIITFAGVMFTFLLWGYSTIDMNKRSNEIVKAELETVLQSYMEVLEDIAAQVEFVTEPLNEDKRVELMQQTYAMANALGYRAKLHIFNNEYEPIIGNAGEVPGDCTANWGIFRQMAQRPENISMKVVTDVEKQSTVLCIGKAMKDGDEIVGYAVLTLDSLEFRLLLTSVPSQSIISDDLGYIYLANNYDFCDNLSRIDRSYEKANGYLKCNGKSFHIVCNSILNQQFYIYSVSDISSQLATFKWAGILMVMLLVIILFFLMRGAEKISVHSTRDIDRIAEAFEKVREGDLNNYIQIDSCEEFQMIGDSYNIMLDSLKEQIEKNREMIAHMAFAQIKQLESQINPHFLFNTLENIRVMCKIDVTKADKMIVNLSLLLRYSISNAEEDVTVRQDMEITESYLSILKIRFNQRFRYLVDIDEQIQDCTIPKLLIQPLIENAIKYGFGDKENLRVEIRGFQEGDTLFFVCRDDGVGIDEDTLQELRQILLQPKNHSMHLGLYNIHKRIQLKYPGNYGVSIESKKGEGTTLILRLPVLRKEN